MFKNKESQSLEVRNAVRGGVGDAYFHHVWKKDSDLNSNMRLFARIVLEPGSSIGYHVHQGEDELYYILAGRAETDDNGTMRELQAGDSTLTRSGEGHSIQSLGPENLEVLAVIVTQS
jgi:Mannose-6-phosphate isomerase